MRPPNETAYGFPSSPSLGTRSDAFLINGLSDYPEASGIDEPDYLGGNFDFYS